MKKIMVVLLLGTLLFSSCRFINERRIVGTWTDIEENRWVFSSNGELTYENANGGDGTIREYTYVVDGAKLTIRGWHVDLQTYDISISADGKTIILTGGKDCTIVGYFRWSVAGPGWSENKLTKK